MPAVATRGDWKKYVTDEGKPYCASSVLSRVLSCLIALSFLIAQRRLQQSLKAHGLEETRRVGRRRRRPDVSGELHNQPIAVLTTPHQRAEPAAAPAVEPVPITASALAPAEPPEDTALASPRATAPAPAAAPVIAVAAARTPIQPSAGYRAAAPPSAAPAAAASPARRAPATAATLQTPSDRPGPAAGAPPGRSGTLPGRGQQQGGAGAPAPAAAAAGAAPVRTTLGTRGSAIVQRPSKNVQQIDALAARIASLAAKQSSTTHKLEELLQRLESQQ
jgi:hypothetical protein